MTISRRSFIATGAALLGGLVSPADAATPDAAEVLRGWYRLVLKLVRHTATYSPPVASRAFAYLGISAYEALASGNLKLATLAGQVNGLKAVPRREAGAAYEDGIVLDAAMAKAVETFFGNTGPTGQRVMAAFAARSREAVISGIEPATVARSEAHGQAVAAHILAWSADDGGAVIENMGFPMSFDLQKGKALWVPTSAIQQQQLPLLPNWGKNRTFAMADGQSCSLPPPPDYSEDPTSQFYKEAKEVCDVRDTLTAEQKAIARFWSDDPMLSPTPPGHWISIALHVLDDRKAGAEESAEVLARVGIAVADAFIGCWASKFQYNLLRPVTYIQRVIEKTWQPLLITPPFPEYPSGHSTQSGAAAVVLEKIYGGSFAFSDATHIRDGLQPRTFTSFWQAAEEAGISRLYGGIHFRAAIERGLDQGRCIAGHANSLRMGAA